MSVRWPHGPGISPATCGSSRCRSRWPSSGGSGPTPVAGRRGRPCNATPNASKIAMIATSTRWAWATCTSTATARSARSTDASTLRMPLDIVAEETLHVGQPLVVDGDSPAGRYAAVFEDDGQTGYFYAIDSDVEDANPIQDALHVYDAADVTDAHLPST